MKNQMKLEGELSRLRGQASQAMKAGDWATALRAYEQGLASGKLPAMEKVEFLEGRAACYRELGDHAAGGEELRKANRVLREEAGKLVEETRQRNAELAVINSVQRGLASNLDIHGIYEAVGEKLREIFNVQTLAIYSANMKSRVLIGEYTIEKGRKLEQISVPFNSLYEYIIELNDTLVKNGDFPQFAAQFRDYRVPQGEMPKSVMIVPVFGKKDLDLRVYLSLQDMDGERTFADSDIRLLETLASSMSIALENARLFAEVQRSHQEIGEALEQQTATSEVLRALSGFQQDLRSLLEIIAVNAAKVCGADDAHIYRIEHEQLKEWTHRGPIPGLEAGESLPLTRSSVIGRAIVDRQTIHIRDAAVELNETEYPVSALLQRRWEYRTVLATPLLRDGEPIGGIAIRRKEVQPFTEKQIALIEVFADQAVIAIENVRLFDETQRLLNDTQQRNAELSIINSVQEGLASRLDLEGIIDLVGDKIREIFDAQSVAIGAYDHTNGLVDYSYVVQKGRRVNMTPTTFDGMSRYMIDTRQPLVIDKNVPQRIQEIGAIFPSDFDLPRSTVYVPLLVGETVTGVINVANHDREQAFSESDVRLLQTLANGLAVALENARLFEETQRLLKETEQRAAELVAINRVSDALVAEPNLEALVQIAGEQLRQIFDADIAYVALLDPETKLIQFPYQYGEEFTALELGEDLTSKIIESARPLLINQDIEQHRAALGVTQVEVQARSYLGVPIFVGGQAIGAISVQSTQTEGRYTVDDVRLLSTIAANVSTAIRNANLFDEINYQRKYYEMIIANSPAAIVLLDEEAKITGWNPAAERLFGYTRAEAMGRDVNKLVANQEEMHAEAAAASHRGVMEGQVHLISKRTRKDGKLVDVEIMALPVLLDGRQTGYIAIYHDITELHRARREAIQANQAKSAFLANMSHELRTPLNAITGFTRIVRRKGEKLLPQKQLDNLDKVLSSSEHLLSLINTLLDIAKIEAGRMDVQAASFQIKPLIEMVGSTTQPLMRQEKVELLIEIAENIPPLHSDQEKIKQILLNLMSNAAKFTHEGSITLKARSEGYTLVVSVADTGIGISPQAMERVFEEFQQADTSTTREYGGTGLGLSISRSLARLLGGDLTVESIEGQGSTFTLTVPLNYSVSPAPAKEDPDESDSRGAMAVARTG